MLFSSLNTPSSLLHLSALCTCHFPCMESFLENSSLYPVSLFQERSFRKDLLLEVLQAYLPSAPAMLCGNPQQHEDVNITRMASAVLIILQTFKHTSHTVICVHIVGVSGRSTRSSTLSDYFPEVKTRNSGATLLSFKS